MSTSPATTATVELLTAEVRTVMVGRRQVTLSVYRQLDEIAPEFIEPFGRVRDDRDTVRSAVYVVGRDRRDGALVRSYVHSVLPGKWRPPEEGPLVRQETIYAPPDEFGNVIFEVNGTLRPQIPSVVTVASREAGGRTYSVDWIVYGNQCRHTLDVPPGEAHFAPEVDAADAAARYAQELDGLVERDRRYDEWTSLPLIVLAGLR